MRAQSNYFLIFILSALLLVSTNSSAQDFYTWTRKADTLFRAKNYAKASNYFEKAMHAIDEVYIGADDFYYCGAAFAWNGDIDKSFFYLTKAIDKGGIASKNLESDPDLFNLRKKSQWKFLVENAKKREADLDVSLIRKLKIIGTNDQFFRKKIDSLYQKKDKDQALIKLYFSNQDKLDSMNLMEAREILKNGFPTRAKVGNECDALFMVIQHATLTAMEEYYPLFEKAAETGDLNWRTLCIMTDRIRKKRGLKQIYGTQIIRDANGKSVLYEVEDFENLNKRRLKIGLESIEEYVNYWGIKL